jgi:hypothetical protein
MKQRIELRVLGARLLELDQAVALDAEQPKFSWVGLAVYRTSVPLPVADQCRKSNGKPNQRGSITAGLPIAADLVKRPRKRHHTARNAEPR